MIALVFSYWLQRGNNSSKDKEANKDSKTINVGTGVIHHFISHDKDGNLTGYGVLMLLQTMA